MFCMARPPSQNSFTTFTIETFPPKTLAACTITVYRGKCVLSLQILCVLPGLFQSFHGAFCTEQWISGCVLVVTLFTFSQGKLAAAVCLGLPTGTKASADLDLCLFTQQNFFVNSAYIKECHTHTYIQCSKFRENQMRWNILYWPSGEVLSPSSVQSL